MNKPLQNHDTLKSRWAAYRVENPKARIRNAAAELGVSEMELLATGLGKTCTRLKPEFAEIIGDLSLLGKVMALTRSDGVVHEVCDTFANLSIQDDTTWFLPPGQDVRYRLDYWKFAFAVNENNRLSLQFFDRSGDATHKIFLREESNVDAYNGLVEYYQMAQQSEFFDRLPDNPTLVVKSVLEPDADELLERWAKVQKSHAYDVISQGYGSQPSAIYHLLASEYTKLLTPASVEKLLILLVEHKQECTISAMNGSVIQSYSGPIVRLLRIGPWFNILDPGFNLHLLTDLIGEVWRVTKPTKQGIHHSIVVLDENGQDMLVINDKQRNGSQESLGWQRVINRL